MNDLARTDPRLFSFMRTAIAETGLVDERAVVTVLQGDGSDRRFFRIRVGASHFICLISPRKKREGLDENDSYHKIGSHLLARGIPVPRIHWADLEEGFFLLEDFGDFHLQRQAGRGGTDLWKLYCHVLRLLMVFHERARCGFQADFCFDGSIYSPAFVYERELEYFRNAFLNTYLNLDVDEEDLRKDFEPLAEAAGVYAENYVIHRDFQSRNLMVNSGKLGLLDFQGVRFGPPCYDLASLMLDPYVALPYRMQEKLVAAYWSAARIFLPYSARQFQDSYRAVSLCRNLQVLGAYGYLGCVKGKKQFLRYIPRAWEQLRYSLRRGIGERCSRIQRWVARIQRRKKSWIEEPLHSKSFA